jgi:hypothetical protein
MIINVTKKDIENGIRGNNCGCPIALAVQRRTNADWASVNDSIVTTDSVYRTPPKARQFICDFDAGRAVKPMRFSI